MVLVMAGSSHAALTRRTRSSVTARRSAADQINVELHADSTALPKLQYCPSLRYTHKLLSQLKDYSFGNVHAQV
jgi:hypothetical protein